MRCSVCVEWGGGGGGNLHIAWQGWHGRGVGGFTYSMVGGA